MKHRLLVLGCIVAGLQTSFAGAIIDTCAFPDNASAQAVWKGREDSPAPTMEKVQGEPAMNLQVNFATSKAGRGCWDREVKLDLSLAEGIQFDIQCGNSGPISGFTLYLKSGKGWHNFAFSPRSSHGWETIQLRKSEARDDEKPEGWSNISMVRIAAWKGGNEDTSFHIRNLKMMGVLGEDTQIVIVQSHDEKARAFDSSISKMLGDYGLRHAIIPDTELTPEILTKTQLAILPYNPGIPDSAVTALQEYLGRPQGRLLAFYSLPTGLEKVTGMGPGKHQMPASKGQFSSIHTVASDFPGAPARVKQASWNISRVTATPGRSRVLAEWYDAEDKPTGFPAVLASENTVLMTHVLLDDDRSNKARLLLSMAGLLRNDLWSEVIASHRAQMDAIGSFEAYDAVVAHLRQIARPGSDVPARLDEVAKLRDEAAMAVKESQFTKAIDAVDAAAQKLREAYCLAQPSKPGEFRAMWCHSAYGVKGLSWDQSIALLKANGFTAIMPNMLWGGVAYYPSEVLPPAADLAERGDQMAACVAACKKHGLQIHVWKVDWNLGHDVPATFVDRMRKEGRLQRSYSGEEQPWLCPSNPANVEMERNALLEVARKYPIDGIHFDYIRYPGPDHCFCDPCRQRFEKATGKTVAQWPKDAQMRGDRREEWITWCQGNINTLVQTTSEQVRRVRPGIKVSAAVFRNWEVDSRIVMQDWKLWCEKGWLDFVCPMDYTMNDGTYDSWVRTQKVLAGPARLVPGIGASATHASLGADGVISQINITRKHDTKGFIIFNYGENEARTTIPLLGLGATKD